MSCVCCSHKVREREERIFSTSVGLPEGLRATPEGGINLNTASTAGARAGWWTLQWPRKVQDKPVCDALVNKYFFRSAAVLQPLKACVKLPRSADDTLFRSVTDDSSPIFASTTVQQPSHGLCRPSSSFLPCGVCVHPRGVIKSHKQKRAARTNPPSAERSAVMVVVTKASWDRMSSLRWSPALRR